jgi:hypothetical protein
MSPIDPAEFMLDPGTTAPVRPRRSGRSAGLFLKGPVPLTWIVRAHAAGGAALPVGLRLRMESDMKGNVPVAMSHKKLATELNISPVTARRAVKSLIEAGLIECMARNGARNVYKIRDQ